MANTTAHAGSIDSGLASGLRAAFERFGDKMIRRHLYRTAVSELRSLSDRELNDLGLSRAGIHAVAYEAAYGRNAIR